jgi:hypothetical protein
MLTLHRQKLKKKTRSTRNNEHIPNTGAPARSQVELKFRFIFLKRFTVIIIMAFIKIEKRLEQYMKTA